MSVCVGCDVWVCSVWLGYVWVCWGVGYLCRYVGVLGCGFCVGMCGLSGDVRVWVFVGVVWVCWCGCSVSGCVLGCGVSGRVC